MAVKVATKYAKNTWIGTCSLDADFQQDPLLFKPSEFFTILLWNINNLKKVKKGKKYFLIKKIQKSSSLQKLHIGQTHFLAIKLILQKIFENLAQEQK